MGQAADCTPSKIIEFWEVLSFVVVRKCRTFAEAFAWGQGNVDNGNISHQKDWKEKKYRLLTPQNRLKSIKSLNLHPLECTLKVLWHISDLLRTKYWVITGCKYRFCPKLASVTIGNGIKSIGEEAFGYCWALKKVYCYATTPPTCGNSAFEDPSNTGATLFVPERCGAKYKSSMGGYFKYIKEME